MWACLDPPLAVHSLFTVLNVNSITYSSSSMRECGSLAKKGDKERERRRSCHVNSSSNLFLCEQFVRIHLSKGRTARQTEREEEAKDDGSEVI